ncbi:MAG: 1,4-dihydroxy-2-naphthoate polyprenyltransferase [Clostridium celatum]|uniref:1,4-dihydroxy-2-naphthoate polyprenyltransferase n=1 Tax=uncultured Clostridium sp. TaxID=59620 RepID=UPI0025E16D22|nr:1,4-dihydroxy-2-naphthoate polyprenyltransferase [uncultured Clostridium sp.]MDU4883094.1 1,4-dihydroxy-2-naphthoate polyprenyltransferase [Clostridium celatum]MDU5262110.1 1,4-dihydroxy-2-naphthoate polyprenyltransferase [Clostridium celatum]MDU7076186.1 1,4-dihydroxy-2-naphthoate polyprenyltransferase [Clostridium celatum]
MGIISFLKLVEIQTKVASIIPYMVGTAFALYKFDNFNMKNAILLFLSMIIFDMTVTAINNYVDYIKAIKKEGFGYEEHNAITKYGLKPKTVLGIIIVMLIVSSLLGILLFLNTNIIILLVGLVCFTIGIFYSFGPIPISRTPFGEIFSGVTMGFFITFLAIYIHIFDKGILNISIIDGNFELMINLRVIISIFVISIPLIVGIANIMLANNICDMEDDFINRRFTLPIYIGKENALSIFKYLYYIGFVGISIGVILKVLPIVSLLTLLVFIPINKNIKSFYILQSKKDTFILAVKNFILLNVTYIFTIVLGILF